MRRRIAVFAPRLVLFPAFFGWHFALHGLSALPSDERFEKAVALERFAPFKPDFHRPIEPVIGFRGRLTRAQSLANSAIALLSGEGGNQ
jgi:hypothetical protein